MNDGSGAAERRRSPRTWLLQGQKAGDNAQLMALGEGLGWPFEVRHLTYRRTELLTNRLCGPTLAGIVQGASSPLQPPWPDLILTAGRRNEPVARSIQARAGGPGTCLIVHLGRPWAALDCFDLIVTTPQYQLPERANVLHNEAPLHRVAPSSLARAAERWRPRLASLPAPFTAVLLGGNAGPYTFTPALARCLAQEVSALARSQGGAVLATTSARTPAHAADAFEAELAVPALVHRWSRGDADNPYLAFLGLAQSSVVTSDSMSMLTDAMAVGRPVFIFDLAGDGGTRGLARWRERLARLRWRPMVYRLGQVLGPARLRRDVAALHRRQIAAGRATWLGQPWPADQRPPPLADLDRAVAAVRALVARHARRAIA